MFDKQLVAQVALRNLIGVLGIAVGIGLTSRGFHQKGAILFACHAGVIKRVDVDGQTLGMLR